MTEYNEKEDRIEANNWYDAPGALVALDSMKFSFVSLAAQCGAPGSHERRLADLAATGFRKEVDYLHDSLRRLLRKAA